MNDSISKSSSTPLIGQVKIYWGKRTEDEINESEVQNLNGKSFEHYDQVDHDNEEEIKMYAKGRQI